MNYFLTRARIPDLGCMIVAARHDFFPVCGKRQATDISRVSLEGINLLSSGSVPDFHTTVLTCRRYILAVRRKRNTRDDTRVPCKSSHLPASDGIPELSCIGISS